MSTGTSLNTGPNSAPPSGTPPKFKSLGVRILSAIVLILICGLPLYYGGWWTIGLSAIFGGLMMSEWVNMTNVLLRPDLEENGTSTKGSGTRSFSKKPIFTQAYFVFLMLGLLASLVMAGSGHWGWALGAMSICGVGAMLLRLGTGHSMWAGLGAIYLILPCLAFVWLRGMEVGHGTDGFKKLVFVLAVVAAADSFAYLGGSIFKGPKFAPKISPNKTWSGFVSGIVGGGVIALIFASFCLFDFKMAVLASIPITIVSVFGDLLESAIKRRLEVKDTGDVLPGHGGILDRVDAMMLALVFSAAALILWPNLWLMLAN